MKLIECLASSMRILSLALLPFPLLAGVPNSIGPLSSGRSLSYWIGPSISWTNGHDDVTHGSQIPGIGIGSGITLGSSFSRCRIGLELDILYRNSIIGNEIGTSPDGSQSDIFERLRLFSLDIGPVIITNLLGDSWTQSFGILWEYHPYKRWRFETSDWNFDYSQHLYSQGASIQVGFYIKTFNRYSMGLVVRQGVTDLWRGQFLNRRTSDVYLILIS